MNNFLGIGGGELVIILIIAVLVVGPEKMVEFATKLGLMVAKIRRMTNDATQEFRDALAIDEVKDAIREVTNEVRDVEKEVRGAAQDVANIKTEATVATQELTQVAEGKTASTQPLPPPTVSTPSKTQIPASGGRIPQVILDRLGPPPARLNPQANDAANGENIENEDAAPVKLQTTTLIEKEEDFEPIEIEDVQVYVEEKDQVPAEPAKEESST
ncbi:MAG: hypothetical protein ACYC6L_16005 [Anaerolineae bacterium]